MFTKIRMRNEKGFTLIELLIVVAIIGILAAIAIPQFAQYRQRGYVAAMKSDLKNAYTAAQSYLTDRPHVTTMIPISGTTNAYVLPGGVFKSSKGNVIAGSMDTTAGSFTIYNVSVPASTGAITAGGTITNVAGTAF